MEKTIESLPLNLFKLYAGIDALRSLSDAGISCAGQIANYSDKHRDDFDDVFLGEEYSVYISFTNRIAATMFLKFIGVGNTDPDAQLIADEIDWHIIEGKSYLRLWWD